MALHHWSHPWGTLLAGLLPAGMLVLLLALHTSDAVSGTPALKPCTAGPIAEDRPFRWSMPTLGVTTLHPRYGWHLPQVRHGSWQGDPYGERPPYSRKDIAVLLSYGQVQGIEPGASDWVELSPTTLEHQLRARFEVEDRGPFHLDARGLEAWADVLRILAEAQRGLGDGERWTLAVEIVPRRGFGTWSAVFVRPPATAAPILRLEGRASDKREVDLCVGEAVFNFAEGNWPYIEWGQPPTCMVPGFDSSKVFVQARLIEAANAVWLAAEAALSEAVRGHESVTLSIDEQHGPVPWRNVVAVTDILLASGVETVSFTPGNFALCFDAAWPPDPLDAWSSPRPLPTLWLPLASLGGLLLALAAGLLRASPSSR